MDRVTYHEQTDMENILKLREVLRTLPEFSRDYFRAIDSTTTTKTRISYAYDIRIFFQFLVNENPLFKDKKTHRSDHRCSGPGAGSRHRGIYGIFEGLQR